MKSFSLRRQILWAVVLVPTTFIQSDDPVKSLQIDVGDLSIQFQDNSQSPGVLSGVQSLFNVKDAPEFDAYDPDGRGSSAGRDLAPAPKRCQSPTCQATCPAQAGSAVRPGPRRTG